MRRRSSSLFGLGLGCGCKESISVSVSVSASETSDKPAVNPRRVRDRSSADTLTLTSPSSSSCWDDEAEEEEGEKPESSASTPGFSELLRQLSELEQNVKAWGRSPPPPPPPGQNREEAKMRFPPHRRSGSEGGRRRIEESVAVVKESADPLGDFRMSMLQMIVEKEIVDGDELRELLLRLLSLNSTHHHDLILQAFAEIWADVFSGCENTNSSSSSKPLHF